MPYIKVKQKYQVTIPAAIREKIDLHEGDMLEAIEHDGKIMLVPQTIMERTKQSPKASLLSLLGSNQNSGLYSSASDADKYIRNLRDEWK